MKKKLQKKANKKVLIGICGSIAAYKVCELIRNLKKANFEVKCILTESAEKFITTLTLQALSNNPVYTDLFPSILIKGETPPLTLPFAKGETGEEVKHISLADWADVIVIVPATANTIAQLKCGFANNLLTSVVLASKAPVLICPAMNTNMWTNPITQENVKYLKKLGFHFLGPDKGDLATEGKGIGRLVSVNKILAKIQTLL